MPLALFLSVSRWPRDRISFTVTSAPSLLPSTRCRRQGITGEGAHGRRRAISGHVGQSARDDAGPPRRTILALSWPCPHTHTHTHTLAMRQRHLDLRPRREKHARANIYRGWISRARAGRCMCVCVGLLSRETIAVLAGDTLLGDTRRRSHSLGVQRHSRTFNIKRGNNAAEYKITALPCLSGYRRRTEC